MTHLYIKKEKNISKNKVFITLHVQIFSICQEKEYFQLDVDKFIQTSVAKIPFRF